MDTREKSAELSARSKRLREQSTEAISQGEKAIRNSKELLASIRREKAKAKSAASGE